MTSMHAVGLRFPEQLRIDTEARLFYSIVPRRRRDSHENWTVELARPLCEPGYFDASGRPPPHSVTGETPAVLHFVGPAKWYHLNRCLDAFLGEARRSPEGMPGYAAGSDLAEALPRRSASGWRGSSAFTTWTRTSPYRTLWR